MANSAGPGAGATGMLACMSIPQHVTKAHATGNDFVVYLDREGRFEPTEEEVRFLADRHFGIGGDGLIRLAHPRDVSDLSAEQIADCEAHGAEWFMDYRNADGSLAEMCGNGTRAITLFAQREGLFEGDVFRLGTRAGVKTLTSLGKVAGLGEHVFRVDMGAWKRGKTDAYEVTIPGTPGAARGTFVDMGNPHVVAVIEDAFSTLPTVEALDLVTKPVVAPAIESDQNVEFVRIDDIDDDADDLGEATMRVNERGCGETLSCGTGLCATAVTLRAKTGVDHWLITVRGGTLRVDVSDTDVTLTGDATIVGDVTLTR
ncbi:diaminopimelate epimerase [Bifidobacterium stellenboschense]|uniref:Diaminopimelate epimerase n=2 Tax=Bifidobacterium stellenboschense TaxID=762211 RepID=A0A087DFN1_9BIFI|nr:diaminopimelate epimerase [Bifidobacterium stellenboschense]